MNREESKQENGYLRWQHILLLVFCLAWSGLVTQGQNTDVFMGRVSAGFFIAFEPGSYAGNEYRLTTIGMQEAVSPEAGEVDLDPYENKVIVIQGHDGGGWLYSASVIEVASPLIAEFLLKQHSAPAPIRPCNTEVILPLFCPKDQALTTIVGVLEEAKQSIDVITSILPESSFTDCLSTAATRGILVRILLIAPPITAQSPAIAGLLEIGIRVKTTIDSAPALLIVDSDTVILGVEGCFSDPWPDQQPILFLECTLLTAALTPVERFQIEFENRWSLGCRPRDSGQDAGS